MQPAQQGALQSLTFPQRQASAEAYKAAYHGHSTRTRSSRWYLAGQRGPVAVVHSILCCVHHCGKDDPPPANTLGGGDRTDVERSLVFGDPGAPVSLPKKESLRAGPLTVSQTSSLSAPFGLPALLMLLPHPLGGAVVAILLLPLCDVEKLISSSSTSSSLLSP